MVEEQDGKGRSSGLFATLGDVGQAVRGGGVGQVIRKLLDVAKDKLPSGGAGPEMAPSSRPPVEPTQREKELEEEVVRLRKQLEDTKLELVGRTASLKNEIFDLKKRNSELLEKVVQLTQKERALSKQVLDAQFAGSGHKADKERLEIEVRDARRDAREAQERAEKAERALAEARERAERAERELTELRRQLSELESWKEGDVSSEAVQELERALDSARERIGQLEAALSERDRRIEQLHQELAARQREVERLQTELEEVRHELRALRTARERRGGAAGAPEELWRSLDASWQAVESALGQLMRAVGRSDAGAALQGGEKGGGLDT